MVLGVLNQCKAWLGDRKVPWVLALGAVLIMLPALNAGLGMDDVLQRTYQLDPAQIPPQLRQTGLAQRSGTLRIVMSELFGFHGGQAQIAMAKNYGTLPWWMRDDFKAALWRPLTAFTHWVDYRLFPGSPALMHAHNMAWFAAAVFLAALLYREFIGATWVAGLAGLLFLLDKNSYFPVMYVANRGFVASLVFGLLCVYEHHRWRSSGKPWRLVTSVLALVAALLSNEAGVSTLAFLIAYALFLDPKGLARSGDSQTSGYGAAETNKVARLRRELTWRALSLLPALVTVVAWRIIYQGLGYGVANVGAYIDPSQEPLGFLRQVGGRSLALLAGQLTGVSPEMGMALQPTLQWWSLLLAGIVVVLVVIVLLPLLRRERAARFWFTAMLLALVPAATVVPMSKNLAFVGAGAFGCIAMLLGEMASQFKDVTTARISRGLAWVTCTALLLAHLPGAVASRIVLAGVTPFVFTMMQRGGDFGDWPGMGDTDIVLVNSPCAISVMATPFVRTYEGKEPPKTLRSLVPACAGFEIRRMDERTLTVRSLGENIFAAHQDRPFHVVHVFREVDRMFRQETFSRGCRVTLTGLEIEVLEVDERQLPVLVSFRFAVPLESPSFRWFYFDWRTFHPRPFTLPRPGENTIISGSRQRNS